MAAAVAIGVVGRRVTLHSLIALRWVDTRVVAAALATPQQKSLLFCMLKESMPETVLSPFRGQPRPLLRVFNRLH